MYNFLKPHFSYLFKVQVYLSTHKRSLLHWIQHLLFMMHISISYSCILHFVATTFTKNYLFYFRNLYVWNAGIMWFENNLIVFFSELHFKWMMIKLLTKLTNLVPSSQIRYNCKVWKFWDQYFNGFKCWFLSYYKKRSGSKIVKFCLLFLTF